MTDKKKQKTKKDALIFHVVGGWEGGERVILQKVNVKNLRAKVLE